MKFTLTPPIEPHTIQRYYCAPWTINIMDFALGQYRIQIQYDGPPGTHWEYPDMVLPNF